MPFYVAEDNEALRQERMFVKIRKNVIMPGTNGVDLDKAKGGWTKFYDNGIITTNVKLFFTERTQRIQYIRTRRHIYINWRYGYR